MWAQVAIATFFVSCKELQIKVKKINNTPVCFLQLQNKESSLHLLLLSLWHSGVPLGVCVAINVIEKFIKVALLIGLEFDYTKMGAI